MPVVFAQLLLYARRPRRLSLNCAVVFALRYCTFTLLVLVERPGGRVLRGRRSRPSARCRSAPADRRRRTTPGSRTIGPPTPKPGSMRVDSSFGYVMYSARLESVEVEPQGRRGCAGELVALELDARSAAPVVGAALGDRVDDAAGRAAELRGVAARLDLDFLDEVRDQVLARHARNAALSFPRRR